MTLKNKKNSKSDHKISIRNGVWMLFSYVAGITFIMHFGVFNGERSENGHEIRLGYHIVWIMAVISITIFITAWAFIRLIRSHPSTTGGGAQYTRTAFGKQMSILYSVFSISVISLLFVSMIVTLRTTLSVDNWLYENVFGDWTNFILDFGGLIFALIAGITSYWGVKRFKKVSTLLSYASWTITGLITIIAFILIFGGRTDVDGSGKKIEPIVSEFKFSSFQYAFIVFFFSYGGFETFISTGKAIKNRRKNLPIIIMISLIMTTLFFMIFSALFLFTLVGTFTDTPNLEIFKRLDILFKTKQHYFFGFGVTIIIIYMLFNRFNSLTQMSYYGSNSVDSLVQQNFLPSKIGLTNANNVSTKGLLISLGLSSFLSVFFLLIPDLIQGFTGSQSAFNFDSVAGTVGFTYISMYSIVILCAVILTFKKKIKSKWWELTLWIGTIAFLILMLVYQFYNLFDQMIPRKEQETFEYLQSLIGSLIQIIFYFSMIGVSIIIRFVVHPKLEKKLTELEKNKLEEFILNHYYASDNVDEKRLKDEQNKGVKNHEK
ncbi:hypothetical protein EELLY_v1c06460 [Entomoplasma ellychniae]|uniref:Amino acid permease n=1 Tax=Entomoplasma ellychniae TaxID=2114 RepID=A0A8E2R005_9MOLU|nr:APC family permease [Entomoplasma ellychniae]PPE04960.1 hypothetical protein EELLY_v1c06460 [Entomoplasma ellychniae]